jgi:hypothetical protein
MVTAGPRPERGVAPDDVKLGRMRGMVRPAVHEDAVALAERLIDVIDLERGLLVAVAVDRSTPARIGSARAGSRPGPQSRPGE